MLTHSMLHVHFTHRVCALTSGQLESSAPKESNGVRAPEKEKRKEQSEK